jgi:hypothetical protein
MYILWAARFVLVMSYVEYISIQTAEINLNLKYHPPSSLTLKFKNSNFQTFSVYQIISNSVNDTEEGFKILNIYKKINE